MHAIEGKITMQSESSSVHVLVLCVYGWSHRVDRVGKVDAHPAPAFEVRLALISQCSDPVELHALRLDVRAVMFEDSAKDVDDLLGGHLCRRGLGEPS